MDALARENGFHRFEWVMRRTDGEEFPVEVTLTPVTLAGRPVLLSVMHDLTERKRAEEQVKDYAVVLELQKWELEKANAELAALATSDGLTGLKNHRAFQERLAVEAGLAARHDEALSLVMLDVDHFKQYNDAHCAPRRRFRAQGGGAHALGRHTRDGLAARYGGEEFVLLLPQTDMHGATVVAERVRKALESRSWPLRDVTASFGVATLRPGELGADLIARADMAMYESRCRAATGSPVARPRPCTAPSVDKLFPFLESSSPEHFEASATVTPNRVYSPHPRRRVAPPTAQCHGRPRRRTSSFLASLSSFVKAVLPKGSLAGRYRTWPK